MNIQKKILDWARGNEKDTFTALELSSVLEISRNATSHHLNRLVDEGVLQKTATRPTLFFLSKEPSDPFGRVVGSRGSLATIISKCQAAVNYPKGLPILLHGNSGTGKSFLAKEIYEYAKKVGVIEQKAPFIVLNCADYANNPELLSSALFGHIKGAYTGADKERNGLLKESKGGFIFLDEVHNLTPENQEKLFLFIDSGKFRQLGDNESWQTSDARLIMATTENISTTFQSTFIRRVPFIIDLPDFSKRPHQERHQLIDTFFLEECRKTDKEILVNKKVIQHLITENSDGNVGQIKNDIKVMVAESINKSEKKIIIPKDSNLDQIIYYSKNMDFSASSKVIDESEIAKFNHIKCYQDLCNEIERILFLIKHTILNNHGSFATFISEMERTFLESPYTVIQKICQKYGLFLSDGDQQDLLLLVLFLYQYGIVFPFSFQLQQTEKIKSFKEHSLAEKIVKSVMFSKENNQQQLMIAAFLHEKMQIQDQIPAIVVMHGENNATSIAYTVNQLLSAYIYDGFDMPLDVNNEELIQEIIDYIKKVDTNKGIVVLVDMGSLGDMYSDIANYVEGDLLLVNNVSTSLALDIGHKLAQREPMETILKFDESRFSVEKKYFEGFSQKPNILISCMSGEGIAVKIKEILQNYVDPKNIELLTMDYSNINQQIKKSDHQIFRNTIAILSTPGFKENQLPVITIEGIVNGSENLSLLNEYLSERSQRQCEKDIVKLFTIEGAGARLTFLNPEMVINEISEVIKAYEDYYHIEIANFLRINLFLHLSTMIERILKQDAIEDFIPEIVEQDEEFPEFISFSNVVFSKIRKKYNIQIPQYEYGLVFQLIKELADNE
ncbi:sigma 54-interacting transcriptional regulator [Enterococcus sp. OL5]|uniref:sigma 54-interacting transcriptional regulator n=1 Tax=Enterococcus sp. OL5 TaxID=2590214 RepID=UPI00112632EE|nr:sigma 54-interacting transcriptional regulator [Enterococcus sp. OL5]TPR56874.1 PRD domain-containing protein [Enterococcus sp. OL5]